MAAEKKQSASVSRQLDSAADHAKEILKEIEALRANLQGVTRVGANYLDLKDVELMGVAEVAEALGISGALVSTWLAREKLPKPIAKLKATPVWHRRQLEPMIKLARRNGSGVSV